MHSANNSTLRKHSIVELVVEPVPPKEPVLHVLGRTDYEGVQA